MTLIVVLRGGWTRYLILGRGTLDALMERSPSGEQRSIDVLVSHRVAAEWEPWRERQLRYLNRNEIGAVYEPNEDVPEEAAP